MWERPNFVWKGGDLDWGLDLEFETTKKSYQEHLDPCVCFVPYCTVVGFGIQSPSSF